MNYKCIGCKSLLDEDDGTFDEEGQFECDACGDAKVAYWRTHAYPEITTIAEYRAAKGERIFIMAYPGDTRD